MCPSQGRGNWQGKKHFDVLDRKLRFYYLFQFWSEVLASDGFSSLPLKVLFITSTLTATTDTSTHVNVVSLYEIY